jgi:hypothetical protein
LRSQKHHGNEKNNSSKIHESTMIQKCPLCDLRLRGEKTAGYRCARCKAHFSAKHLHRMARAHIKRIIHVHFSPKETLVEQIVMSPKPLPEIPDQFMTITELRKVVEQARKPVRKAR